MLNELYPGGFRHNEQSLRVVDLLENDGKGLNLTWEVRDGILRHSKSREGILGEGWEPAGTLEGEVCKIADVVAYINHDTADALRAGARQDLEQEAARQADAEVRRQLIEQIVGANNLEAPRPLVERLLATYAQGYEIPDDQLERFAGEFRPLAEAQVRRDLVLDYVVEKQKLQATEEELDQRVAKIAGRRQADPGQVYASLQKAGRLRELERQITEEKAFAHLLQQSTVTEA
ncbi:MAG: hypothetical protein HYY94_06525 [Gemmatimonadetes bacterium]|nr:hypothetical protein [Gemmatimonadota bacterium]